jgi:cytochrome c
MTPVHLIAVLVSLTAALPAAAADPAMGAKLFLQCRACHVVGPGDAPGVGPNLRAVVGARAGSRPGYAYSPAMAGSGITWDASTLDTFLKKPSAAVPGTKMIFAGVPADAARADIIAYLSSLK